MATATQMSKKRKFIANGVFFAELNEVLTRELAEDGYSGVEVRGMKIRELTSVVQKRFKFPKNSVELYVEKVNNRGLCAIAQAESLRYKLLGDLAVRRMFIANGVFFTELNEVLTRELAEDGYSGVEVRVMPMRTQIIIRAT
ncbi:hypothetical protein FF2_001395 [Malus domestica]